MDAGAQLQCGADRMVVRLKLTVMQSCDWEKHFAMVL